MRRLPQGELEYLYRRKFYTYEQLAKHFHCSTLAIKFNIERYEIPKMPKGNFLFRKLEMQEEDLKKLLIEFYLKQKKSTYEIANRLDTDPSTVSKLLRRMGIVRGK